MAWSPTLLARLAMPSPGLVLVLRRADPIDRLDRGEWVYASSNPPMPSGDPLSAGSEAGSTPGLMRAGSLADGRSEIQMSPPSPAPARGSWSASLALKATECYTLFSRISRGQAGELLVGWIGLEYADYERVAVGIVRNVRRGSDGVVTIEFDDFAAYLQSRGAPTAITESNVFGALELSETVITTGSPYSSGDAVMHVDDTSNAEAGPLGYLLKVFPTGNDPYYILATGKTVSTFTGCTTAFGTVHTASGGDVVIQVAYDADHPSLIARRILQAGAAGAAHAGYPDSWGLGIPDAYLDETDSDLHQSGALPTPSGSDATLIVESAWDNGESELATWLGFFGLFVTQRQGSITVRAVRDPEAIAAEFAIAEGIVDFSWSAWSDEQPDEYAVYQVRAEQPDGTWVVYSFTDSSAGPRTLPSIHRLQVASGTRLWAQPDDAAWAQEVADRLGPWYVRIPEVLTVTMAGLEWAQLAPGDIGTITLRDPIGIVQDLADLGYVDRVVMVQGVRVDWLGGIVQLDLLARPLAADE